ncbi:MAG: ester cyclase [Chlamydiae bacterium]|nr:ester cyclase [Chlamydiota bacterium]
MQSKEYPTVRRLYQEVWNQKKLHVIDEIFAPDFSIHAGDLVIRDKQILKDFIKSWLTSFPDIHHEIDEIIGVENKVALRFHGKGTHKAQFLDIPPTNKSFSYTGMNFIHLENQKIKKLWLNSSMYELINYLKE